MKSPLLLLLCLAWTPLLSQTWVGQSATFDPTFSNQDYRRHECGAGLCEFDGQELCIMIGGRGNGNKRRPVLYDRALNHLTMGAQCPVDYHHFQAVVWRDSIVVLGMGLTGGYPNETPHQSLYLYHAKTDTWELKSTIPASRRRGSAQAVLEGDWVYYFNGLTNGHQSGWVNQADRFNLVTGVWETMTASPRARDHSVAVRHGDQVYLVGGRRSNQGGAGLHALPVYDIDVYDLPTDTWATLPASADLPEARAGLMAVLQPNSEGNPQLNVWGGEYGGGTRSTGKGLNLTTLNWISLPPLPTTLHGAQIISISPDSLVLIAGAINGGSEIDPSSGSYVQNNESFPQSLPITWNRVQATRSPDGHIHLEWEVEEHLVAQYEVLRQGSPGGQPELVGMEISLGEGQNTYAFDDAFAPGLGILYYQIRSIDYDGTPTLSPRVEVQLPKERPAIFPTSVSPGVDLLEIQGGEPRYLSLVDLQGRELWSGPWRDHRWPWPAGLTPGIYLVKVQWEEGPMLLTRIWLQPD